MIVSILAFARSLRRKLKATCGQIEGAGLIGLMVLMSLSAQGQVLPALERTLPNPTANQTERDSLGLATLKIWGKFHQRLAAEGKRPGGKNLEQVPEHIKRSYAKSLDSLLEVSEQRRKTREAKQIQMAESSLLTTQSLSVSNYDLVPDSIEFKALRDLYDSTKGPNWTTKWPANIHTLTNVTSAVFGKWHGVIVSNGDVVQLKIAQNNLRGPLPPTFCNLTRLNTIWLHNNALTGSIPTDIGRLTLLWDVSLTSNQLSGPIPESFGNLKSLWRCYINSNRLSGPIPDTLGGLSSIWQLGFNGNRLTGPIPASLGRLRPDYNGVLDFGYNQLTGSIPASLGNLTKIGGISFMNNRLSGPLPAELGQLVNISQFYLANNIDLNGPLPASFANLTKLSQLYLQNNSFSGPIPPAIGNFPNLKDFYIYYNQFTSLPNFSSNANKANLRVWALENKLDFGSIEANMVGINQPAVSSYLYSPQALFGQADTLASVTGERLELVCAAGGTHSRYQWQKQVNGIWQDLIGDTTSVYIIDALNSIHAGTYRCQVTNRWATLLTLYSHDKVVSVSGDTKLAANLPNLNCPPTSPAATPAPAPGSANPLLNYVRTYTAQVPGISATNISAAYWPVNEVLTATEYLDGLGRPIQTVQKMASPLNQDIIQPIAYDAFGRQHKDYLPYTRNGGSDGNFRPSALLEQYNYYQSFNFYNGNQPRTGYPYAEKEFEASPLNRVLRQSAPGESWKLGSGHELQLSERSNTAADAVRLWLVIENASSGLSSPSTYAAGELFVSSATDEHGFRTLEFKDKEGRVVLKKAEKAAGQYVSTYYVYDDLGQLRYVLPPKAVETMAGSNWQLTTAAKALVFRYNYDARQRLIEKQVPGAAPVYLVYNKRDLPILTQEGNQRLAKQWSFTKYDELNRPVFTGVVTDTLRVTREDMQQAADGHSVLYETKDASTWGHTFTQAFPTNITSDNLYTITYYDGYNVYTPQFVAEAGHTARHDRVLGQVTGKQEKILGSPTWLATTYFYDDEYRIIQTNQRNNINGIDRITTRYDFTGKVLETLTTHSNAAGATQVVQQTMTYDHAGRLLNTYQRLGTDPAQINAQAQVLVAQQQYNELGQVVDKKLHSTDNGNSFLQSVDYRYNIRGWLTHINNSALANDNGTTNNDDDDLFGLELSYEDCGFQKSYFNGNIAGVKWQSGGDRIKRAYGYQYDGLSRLLQADYRAFNPTTQTWTGEQLDATNGNFDMWGLRYDSNGNITALNRNGLRAEVGTTKTYGLLDQLSYKYEAEKGNQLRGVDDSEVTPLLHDFEDKAGRKYSIAAPEYSYDANGNLIKDDNKGITVTYNHLNLPLRVNFGNGKTIDYQYTASGARVRKTVAAPSQHTIFTDYVGAMVYQNNALQFAQMAEGRLLYQPTSSNKWRYEYHLKDHLGNLRVAVAEATTNTMMATMEASRAMTEDTVFTHVETTRQQDQLRARTGSYAARLNAAQDRLLGPGKRLPVQKGDSVSVEVFGHYEQENKSNVAYSLGAWLLSKAVVQVQEPAKEGSKGNGRPAFPFISAGIAATPQVVQRQKGVPQAYLKYIAYDTAGNYLSSHYQVLSQTAQDSWEPLQLNYQPEQDGYVDIYVANESGEEVFFDDLTISSVTPMTIQENHYDPWGQNLVGIEKLGSPDYKFQYNGKEKQHEFDLNWSDYGARMYDPQLGRWNGVDALAEEMRSYSPYNYGLNNPLRFTDPDGNAPTDIILLGKNSSSVTIKTDLIDIEVNASSLGVDFGGNYSVSGNDIVQAAVDIAGVFDPTPASDILGAQLSASSGDYWGAAASGLGAAVPYAGDLAKAPKIAKGLDKIGDAIDAAKAVNGNSKASSKAQHVYEIYKTGKNGAEEVVKTGVSSGKVSKAGDSYRATSQVNKWNKAEGAGTYKSRIVENIPAGKGARQKALDAEKANARKLQDQGHLQDPKKHVTPR